MKVNSLSQENILILDFGSQYTQLILKKLRKIKINCLIEPCNISYQEVIAKQPNAIILSGGPSSVYSKNKPIFDRKILSLNIPILGICYGMQLVVNHFGGKVISSKEKEYGNTSIKINSNSILFNGIKKKKIKVWMSHGDKVKNLSKEFIKIANSSTTIAAIENKEKKIYCLQYHPEVDHSEYGEKVLKNFVSKISRTKATWDLPNFIDQQIKQVRKKVGKKKIFLALSGGVDSTVLAALLHKAVGKSLICIFINNGLLRFNEENKVHKNFKKDFNIQLKYINASEYFLKKLKDITDPEKKRAIIGKCFVDVFLNYFKENNINLDFLAQGTLYPDVIESISVKGPSDTIKTHHNRVKEIIALMKQNKIIEPFAFLFKDEVRQIGKKLKVKDIYLKRQPFPGPGLAIRILGNITLQRLEILKQADGILLQEIKLAKYYQKVWQCFAVLLPIKSVGVMGDQRKYGYTIVLRIVSSNDGMTADFELLSKKILEKISNRIIGEVEQVTRVTLDITSKPPATIEWE